MRDQVRIVRVPSYAIRSHQCTGKVLEPFLDHFVVVYLDDIVVYSQIMDKHVEHLRQVFQVLRSNELYVKGEVLVRTRGSDVPRPHHWKRKDSDGSSQDLGYIGVGTSHQGDGVTIFPWLGKLPSEVH